MACGVSAGGGQETQHPRHGSQEPGLCCRLLRQQSRWRPRPAAADIELIQSLDRAVFRPRAAQLKPQGGPVMKTRNTLVALSLTLGVVFALPAGAQEVLPRPQQPFKGKIARTASESTPDFPKGIVAPKGAPNVLLI